MSMTTRRSTRADTLVGLLITGMLGLGLIAAFTRSGADAESDDRTEQASSQQSSSTSTSASTTSTSASTTTTQTTQAPRTTTTTVTTVPGGGGGEPKPGGSGGGSGSDVGGVTGENADLAFTGDGSAVLTALGLQLTVLGAVLVVVGAAMRPRKRRRANLARMTPA